jgi:hypothetical protein
MTTNRFEETARLRKVLALVDHFDAYMSGSGLDPKADSPAMVDALQHMKQPIWTAHAAACGLKSAPSDITIALVIDVYRERAKAQPEGVAALEEEDPFARCGT